MLEAITIMSIVFACLYFPLRGKTYEELSEGQAKRVQKNYANYMRTKKGQKTPDLTVQEYLPILAKQGKTYLIMAIVMVPIYIIAVIFVYSRIFSNI